MQSLLIISCLVSCGALFVDELQDFEKECIGEEKFTCFDGGCIPQDRYCDGRPDCADGSDEDMCPDHAADKDLCTATHQFLCRDGHCLPATWVCNGVPDCTDASDEANCTELPNNSTESKCSKGFACGDGKCISSLWACDGHYDCEDRSDENIETTCKHSLKAHTRDGRYCEDFPHSEPRNYKCLDSSHCLTGNQMCDGITDCRDGSDEGPFCSQWKSMCINSTCPANVTECTPERHGPRCICDKNPNHFWFNHTSQSCQDVDECLAERPVCSQRCQNFDGHYHCYCDKGYVMDQFKYLCFAEDPEAMLFYSTGNDIRYFKVKTKQEITVLTGIKKSHGVSYDGKYLYWVETAAGHQAIARAHLENPIETKEILVSLGLDDPGDVAVDWIGGHIYFSDQKLGVIHVCKTDGSICARLNTLTRRPRFVTLDARKGIMYWADITPEGKHAIMRARMDGSHAEALVDDLENFATGLAIDVPNDRLYFVDKTVRVLKVDTLEVYSFFEIRLHHPYAIAVFENTVFWSDLTSNTIQSNDKVSTSWEEKRYVLATLHSPVYGMHIYHPVLMTQDTNPCATHNCSHMCLLASNTTHTCACPVGMLLNGSVCYNQEGYHPQYLIVGAGSSFTRIQYDVLGNPETHATTFDIGRVQAMAFDSRRDILYVYDGMRKVINTIGMTDFRLGVTRVFIYKGLENVVDMDYDPLTDNLYVLDAGRHFLEVFSLKDGKRALLHRFPDHETPISFCIVQDFRKLLVALIESEQNNEIRVDSIDLDGGFREHQHVVMNDLKGPRVRLRTFQQIIIASDESSNSIEIISPYTLLGGIMKNDTMDPSMHSFINGLASLYVRKPLPTPVGGIAVTPLFMFWTDTRTPRIFWQDTYPLIESVSPTPRRMELSLFSNDTQLHIQATSHVLDTMLSSHPCSKNPCSHICVQGKFDLLDPLKFSYKCLCPPGLRLEGGECHKLLVCGHDELYCYESNTCVPRAKKCDGIKDCAHGEDEKDCTGTTMRPSTNCLQNQVECNGGCIHVNEICPKEISGSINPSAFSCEFDQFQCVGSSICLEREQVCDEYPDCPDGSDEGAICHTQRCEETEFMCTSGNCIKYSLRCDGESDCNDGSDEEDCANRTCNAGFYQCRSGQCVDIHRRCDGQPDCVDGSDEEQCQEPEAVTPSCADGELPCELNRSICVPQTAWCNKVVDCPGGTDEVGCPSVCAKHGLFECKHEQICVYMHRVCDHKKDCTDGSDETPEACAQVKSSRKFVPAPLPPALCHHGFPCRNGQCIEWHEVCDNTPNCFDGSDENGHCFTACENITCSQHCQPTPLGPQCTCRPGFELLPDQRSCVDIDECRKDLCSHHCTNIPGSFLCSCRHGYTLRSDRRSCKANIGSTKSILFTSGSSVRSISDLGLGRVEFDEPTLGDIADVDVNVALNKFYVTSPETGKLIEVTSPELGMPINGTDQNVITNIGKPTKVAVDWITGNVYFVDSSMQPTIKVCNFQKKRCAKLKYLPTNATVTSLVVSPETRNLYYCLNHQSLDYTSPVWGVDLTGSNQINPQFRDECIGLAVDGNILYVAGRRELWTFDPNGSSSRKEIRDWSLVFPRSIIIFEDHVYVLSYRRIYNCLTFGPKTCQHYIIQLPYAEAFVIRHPSIQRQDLKNDCDHFVCDNVCVLGDHGPKCLCEDGRVSEDGKCSLLDKGMVPLFNGLASQDVIQEHQVSLTLVSITVFLFIMYLTIFVYYHCVYRPRKDALTLPVRFQNQTSVSGSPLHTPTIEMPTASDPGHEFVNPLQFVRSIWQRSFGRGSRPVGTAGLTFDIPRPKEDLSDTESDMDYKDEKILIR